MGSALRSISFVLYDRVFPTLSDAASNRVDMKIDASWVSRVLTSILSCDDDNKENVIEIFVGGLLGIKRHEYHSRLTKTRTLHTATCSVE